MEDEYETTAPAPEGVFYAQREPDGIVILNGYSELIHTFPTQRAAEDVGWTFGGWWVDWAGFDIAEVTFDSSLWAFV